MATISKPFQVNGKMASLFLVLLFIPVPALAYLDPTTGSMIISAIVGLFASLVLAIKTYWYRLKGFFQRKPEERPADDDDN
jgi:hypothetical protein